MSDVIGRFKQVYNSLNASNIGEIKHIYDENIVFVDPFHRIEGIDNLFSYFAGLYRNVKSCHINFDEVYERPDSAMLTWNMFLKHRTMSKNQVIEVSGSTQIHFEDKIYFHRDYFDAGEMVYENLSLVGPIVKFIKQKV